MNFRFMICEAIEAAFKKHLFWISAACFNSIYVYKDKYGAKYFGLPVVRYLFLSTSLLKAMMKR